MSIADKDFADEIRLIVGEDRLSANEPMKLHTTFRAGGCADWFVSPSDRDEIRKIIECCKRHKTAYYILGNGSNVLVRDEGFRGIIIHIGDNFSKIRMTDETVIEAEAGARLSAVGNDLAARGLAGFEFASGIPGTVGGAVVMNAGAYGGEIKDIIISAEVLSCDGEFTTLSAGELELGYRTSIIQKKGYTVLSAVFRLERGDEDDIRGRMKELAQRRREKQPLEYPSAGSTFKRPEGYYAARLIEDAGLKGVCIGGAQVSEKHAGFVINTGNATAADILKLTNEIRKRVMEVFGIKLELEVKII